MHEPRRPKLPNPAFLPFVPLMAILPSLGGCVSRTESFAGHDPAAVWTAMVKAAEEPDLKDWKTVDNDIWSDAASRRIEIHRLNRRFLYRHDEYSRMESREWDFAVSLGEPEADGAPPEVTFAVRGAVIPAWGWHEADAFFTRMWEILGGKETEMSAARRKYLETLEAERAGEPRPQADPDGDDLMHPKPLEIPTEFPVDDPAVSPPPPPVDVPER
jgi:hypothetical protein